MTLSPDQKTPLKEMMEIPEFEEAIKSRLPNLLQAIMDIAQGHLAHQVRRDPDSGEWSDNCHDVPPDRLACQFLIENVIGKVPTRVEMTGKDGEAMKIIPWMPKLDAIGEGVVETIDEEEVRMLKEAKDDATK